MVVAWLIAVVFLFPLANSLSGVTNNSNAANLPASAPSTRVIALELQQASRQGPGQPQTDTAFVVFARSKGLTAADMTAILARAAVGRLARQASGLAAPSPVRRSADGQAAIFTANVTAPASSQACADTAAVRAIRGAVGGLASRAGDGLQAEVTGGRGAADIGTPTTTILELTALVIVALVFFVVYRSPLLWLFPLLGAVAGIQVAQAGAHGLASAGLTVSPLSADILIVLVFGAASDYALLLIHRYREELCRHPTTEDAMAAALRRTLPTLLASSGTVTIAMICLLAAQSRLAARPGPGRRRGHRLGPARPTTFLPALLLVLGLAAFWPRAPRAGAGRPRRIPPVVGHRHPGRPPPGPGRARRRGAARRGLRRARRPAHRQQQPRSGKRRSRQRGRRAANRRPLPGRASSNPSCSSLRPARPAPPPRRPAPPRRRRGAAGQRPVEGYASDLVIMSVPPYGASGHAVIAHLRQQLDRDAPGSLAGGDPAVQYDITQASAHDALLLVPLLLVVRGRRRPALAGGRRSPGAGRHHRAQLRGLVRAVGPAVALRAGLFRHRIAGPGVHLHLPGRARRRLQHLPGRPHPGGSPAPWASGRAPCAGSASPAASSPPPASSSPPPSPPLSWSPRSTSPRSGPPWPSASCSTLCSYEQCWSQPPCSPSASLSGGPRGHATRQRPRPAHPADAQDLRERRLEDRAWVRLRDEGTRSTLTLKQVTDATTINGTTEVETVVGEPSGGSRTRPLA